MREVSKPKDLSTEALAAWRKLTSSQRLWLIVHLFAFTFALLLTFLVIPLVLLIAVLGLSFRGPEWLRAGALYAARAISMVYSLLFCLLLAMMFLRSRAESNVRQVVHAAQTTNELARAIGSLGAFFSYPDGSWLAICYRDAHLLPMWSYAFAKDSEGRSYESHHHFCGTLRSIHYHATNKSSADFLKENDFGPLAALASATNVAEAKSCFLEYGFTQVNRK